MRWFAKDENKFYNVYMGLNRRSMNLHGEDANIEPELVKFIRKMVDKWELEWLQDEAK